MTASERQRRAAISLDLDDLWAYLRSAGYSEWSRYPSFLDLAVPRIIDTLSELGIRATIFVVARDAEHPINRNLLTRLRAAGHDIANHSFMHEPNFGALTPEVVHEELDRSEEILADFVDSENRGFRAPAFALSKTLLVELAARGYQYDSSLFPSSVGALVNLYDSFRYWRGLRRAPAPQYGAHGVSRYPLSPFVWQCESGSLVEIPVSTMPALRLPMHWTYLFFLAARSRKLASAYLRTSLRFMKHNNHEPVLLLHATDFIGKDDPTAPGFLPGMSITVADKLAFIRTSLRRCMHDFTLVPLAGFAASMAPARELPVRALPDL